VAVVASRKIVVILLHYHTVIVVVVVIHVGLKGAFKFNSVASLNSHRICGQPTLLLLPLLHNRLVVWRWTRAGRVIWLSSKKLQLLGRTEVANMRCEEIHRKAFASSNPLAVLVAGDEGDDDEDDEDAPKDADEAEGAAGVLEAILFMIKSHHPLTWLSGSKVSDVAVMNIWKGGRIQLPGTRWQQVLAKGRWIWCWIV
jgi:hypothetical protein